MKVLGGVFTGRTVTTTYVAATQAQTEVDPAAAGPQALLASLWGVGSTGRIWAM